jgi:hypothetical protein
MEDFNVPSFHPQCSKTINMKMNFFKKEKMVYLTVGFTARLVQL